MNILSIGGGNKAPAIEYARNFLPDQSVAIIPTACSTVISYNKKVAACLAFFDELGMQTEVLHNFEEMPPPHKVADILGAASMMYVIGGNTPHLLRTLPKYGAEQIRAELTNNKTLAGTSAGALLPFAAIHTCPAKQPAKEPGWDYNYVGGLGIIDAAATAHANKHDPTTQGPRPENRRQHFLKTLHNRHPGMLGIAIDNDAALFVQGSTAQGVFANPDATIHLVQDGNLIRVQDDAHLSGALRPILHN